MPKRKKPSSVQVRDLLHQSGTHAKKSLGQHFLTDENVLQKIISAAGLSNTDNVVEVGPGLGALTEQLARYAGHVFAIELDNRLAAGLKRKFNSLHNITVINDDILKVDLVRLLKGSNCYKVVANLPYYITSPVLQYFVNAPVKPLLMVVMVQKEVGDAIVAKPGDLSVLAISLQIFTEARIIDYVPASCFYPEPKVDSAIILLNFLPEPAVDVDNISDFLGVVRRGFRAPRKQIRNSLAKGMNIKPSDAAELLKKAGIERSRRPETLCLNEWQRLYEKVKSLSLL